MTKLYDSDGNWIGVEESKEITVAEYQKIMQCADPELRRKWLNGDWDAGEPKEST